MRLRGHTIDGKFEVDILNGNFKVGHKSTRDCFSSVTDHHNMK